MVGNFCCCILVISNGDLKQAKTATATRVALVENVRTVVVFKLQYANVAVVVLIVQNT